jgi:hypothetical protein
LRELADDYEISSDTIAEAIRCELDRAQWHSTTAIIPAQAPFEKRNHLLLVNLDTNPSLINRRLSQRNVRYHLSIGANTNSGTTTYQRSQRSESANSAFESSNLPACTPDHVPSNSAK